MLTREYYDLQATHDRRVAELTARVDSLSEKLTSYEKLEVELDAVVMQSAEGEAPYPSWLALTGSFQFTSYFVLIFFKDVLRSRMTNLRSFEDESVLPFSAF